MLTQKQIESLDQEEYCHLLSYGEPLLSNEPNSTDQLANEIERPYHLAQFEKDDDQAAWISTLESMTYPDMTFGYHEHSFVALCPST